MSYTAHTRDPPASDLLIFPVPASLSSSGPFYRFFLFQCRSLFLRMFAVRAMLSTTAATAAAGPAAAAATAAASKLTVPAVLQMLGLGAAPWRIAAPQRVQLEELCGESLRDALPITGRARG